MSSIARRGTPRPSRPQLVLVAGCLAAVALSSACGGSSPSASPTSAAFELTVSPQTSIGQTIAGQPTTFLVSVSGAVGDPPVTVSATASSPNASVVVDPPQLTPGVIGEVTIIPPAVDAETPLDVGITATRGGVEQAEVRTLTIAPGEDTLAAEARQHLDPFVRWLATERPELGIDSRTVWSGAPGAWVLVVEHYQFLSEDWELGLSWHVMIAPDDWSRVYLRHRRTEIRPSLALEIASVSSGTPPRLIAPPDTVWR